MCYTAIPGKTGCLAIRDVPQTLKLEKSATASKKKATSSAKCCGRTKKGKPLSRDEVFDEDSRKAKNAKAKCAKRNQHHFGHARKDVASMKRAACT